uniref:OSJNBa0004B13.25 protein n=1 Tax=Oryza sativa subsp. japonica TaxID=39947 RepID=Q7F726_ORYSJ|nr:OSJNBa0004B13.25 [Oryza sativa Japonica Group]
MGPESDGRRGPPLARVGGWPTRHRDRACCRRVIVGGRTLVDEEVDVVDGYVPEEAECALSRATEPTQLILAVVEGGLKGDSEKGGGPWRKERRGGGQGKGLVGVS